MLFEDFHTIRIYPRTFSLPRSGSLSRRKILSMFRLDNVVLLDLLFQLAIVAVQRFFLFWSFAYSACAAATLGELAADQRGLDRSFAAASKRIVAVGGAVCRLVLCSAVCVITGFVFLICRNML